MKWFQLVIRTIIVLFLQIAIFNHLPLFNLCHPYIYILLLICLPIMPRYAEMLVGFALGVIMDCVCSSAGIHTMACVAISYIRPIILSRKVQEIERVTGEVVAGSIGNATFALSSIWLTLIHHLIVFSLDTWSWAHWYWVVLQVIISGSITLACVYVYGFLLRRS